MGGFFGPFVPGAVATGVLSEALAAGDVGTIAPAGFGPSIGTLVLTPDASDSSATGMTAGYEGQWCVIIVPSSASGTLTLNVGAGNFEGSGDLTLSAGQQCRCVYQDDAWNIA